MFVHIFFPPNLSWQFSENHNNTETGSGSPHSVAIKIKRIHQNRNKAGSTILFKYQIQLIQTN